MKPAALLFISLTAVLSSPPMLIAIEAGVSVTDITPPPGFEMWGAAGRRGFAEGALDPLYARTIVLKTDSISIGIVVLDLGRTFSREQMDRVRRNVKRTVGISHVLFSATHTHTGPNILDDRFIESPAQRWEPAALEKITRGIETAYQKRVPARIGVARGQAISATIARTDPPAAWVKTSPVFARRRMIRSSPWYVSTTRVANPSPSWLIMPSIPSY